MATSVLVGYDGSDHAKAAVAWAAPEALSRGVGLTLVSAFVPPTSGPAFSYGGFLSPDALEDVVDRARAALAEEGAEIAQRYPGLTTTVDVAVASPAAALVEASRDACLTVVGSRGFGGFRGLVLGSVGMQVATHAHSPVVVVRKPPDTSATTVVVGIDGSPLSLKALGFAFDIASRRGWSLRLVHAWEIPSYDVLAAPSGPPPLEVDVYEEAEDRVNAEALAGFRDSYPDVAVEEKTVRGPAARGIIDNADGAALIVLGSHGRGEFLGALLGSVSQGVLHRAGIPVAVVGSSS